MENLLFIGIGIAVVAVIVGKFIVRRRGAKKTEGFAAERGWRYEKSDATVLDSYPQVFPFYSPGRSVSRPGLTIGGSSRGDNAQNVMHLMAGEYPGHSFTYTYATQDRDSDGNTTTQHEYWHVVGLELPVAFPNMIIRRRRKLDALENRLTKPVEVPDPELTRAYTIHSEHPPAVLDTLTPEMVQWLVAEQFRAEMVLQDTRLFVYSKGKQKMENIDPMLAQLTGFVSRIPAQVWTKAQGEYPRPQRVQMVDGLNLNMMKDAYDQWRETK